MVSYRGVELALSSFSLRILRFAFTRPVDQLPNNSEQRRLLTVLRRRGLRGKALREQFLTDRAAVDCFWQGKKIR